MWPFRSRDRRSDLNDQQLVEIAKALSEGLLEAVPRSGQFISGLILGEGSVLDQAHLLAIESEIALLCLHLMDREAFARLGSSRRQVFMDALLVEVREGLSRRCTGGVEAEAFRNAFVHSYNVRQEKYSKFKKLFAEPNEGLRNTLFWEFGKDIAAVYTNNMKNPVICTLVAADMAELYILLLKVLNALGL